MNDGRSVDGCQSAFCCKMWVRRASGVGLTSSNSVATRGGTGNR